MSGPQDGEVWVICEKCGFRLRSEDCAVGKGYKGVPCPYGVDCIAPEEKERSRYPK